MPKEKVNPESLKEIKAVEVTDDIRHFTNEIARDVEAEKSNRGTWEANIDKYIRLRYGIRNKKTHPWPNCANYALPLIDSDIKRIKPSYVNLAFGVSPIVTFEPFGSEDVEPSRKRETLFDWRMRTQVKFFEPYNYAIDKMLEQGATVMKVVWDFKTSTYTEFLDLNDMDEQTMQALYDPRVNDDILFKIIVEELDVDVSFEENVKEIGKTIDKFRKGETKFEMTLQEVKVNRPKVVARDLRQDITIPIDTLVYEDNLDDARFIDDKIWMSKNDLKIGMKDKKYIEYPDSDIDSWAGKQEQKTTKTTTTSIDDDIILLHETCVWYDVDNDGIEERCIVTYPDSAPERVLRFIELPYDHGQWPYTLIKRELNDPGVYSSRGIAALQEDYQNGVSTAFNQAVDNGTIVNTPKVVARKNTVTNLRNLRYIPGEAVITNGPTSDYEIRQQLNTSQNTLFQQSQYLKSWANQQVGNLSSGMSDPIEMGGAGQGGKKTAKEVETVSFMHSQVQSLDLQVFQQQMARVYYQIDALYYQFGDDEEEVTITGQQPMKITRRDIQGKFNLIPNGRLDNANPQIRATKALNVYRLFVGDPDVKQYELKKLFLNDYDSRIAGKILMTPEEIQQRDQQMQQQQEAMKKALLGEQVGAKRLENSLELEKELGIEIIHGKKYAEG